MNKKKKILHIESGLSGKGGSVNSLFQEVLSLNTIYDSEVVFCNQSPYYKIFSKNGVNCHIAPSKMYDKQWREKNLIATNLFKFLIKLDLYFPFFTFLIDNIVHYSEKRYIYNLIMKNCYDIVHTNNQPNRDMYAILCSYHAGTPIVSHLRSFFTKGFNLYRVNRINKIVDAYVAYSRGIAQSWIDAGLDEKKVFIIPNVISDIEANKIDLHKAFIVPKFRKIVGIVGSLIPARGHLFFLDAFQKLVEDGFDIQLIIVGEGDIKYKSSIIDMIKYHGIEDKVTFTGYRSDSRDIISSLDILIMPYSIEPFGRVLLEAWSLKTPVILTDVGYIKEIVSDGDDALIVPYGDVFKMALSVKHLLVNDSLNFKIVHNAYIKCRNNYSLSVYRERMSFLYKSVLEKRCKSNEG